MTLLLQDLSHLLDEEHLGGVPVLFKHQLYVMTLHPLFAFAGAVQFP